MTKALATVYDLSAKLYVHSSSQTTTGLWMVNEAPVLMPGRENATEIGASVRQCLEASRQGVPHPTTWANRYKLVLRRTGVRSHRAFMTTAKCVTVYMDGGTITVEPTRNEGHRGGFGYLPGKTKITLGSDEALGVAVLEALAKST